MTGFNLDFSKAVQTGGVKDGTYEVVVNRVSEDATKGGSEYMEFDLIIRNDIDQPYKNAHIFAKNWKAKKDNKYNEGMIMAVAKACGLEDGKQYSSLDELMEDFSFKTTRVTVKNEESESNGTIYQNLNVKKWEESASKGVMNHQFKQDEAPADVPKPTIEDDDLPF